MMIYILSAICIIGAILASLILGNRWNPFYVFNLYWGGIIFLSKLGLYGIFVPEDSIYMLIMYGIISFNVTALLMTVKLKGTRISTIEVDITEDRSKSNRLLFMLAIIAIIFLTTKLITVTALILQGYVLSDIRVMNFDIKTGDIDVYIDRYIVQSIALVLYVRVFVDLVIKKSNTRLLLLTLIILVETVIVTGGRYEIYYTLISLLLAMTIYEKKWYLSPKLQWRLKLMFILLVFMLVYITNLRSVQTEESAITGFLKMIYVYFVGCVEYMEQLVAQQALYQEYSYGFSSLGGIINPIFVLLTYLGLMEYPIVSSLISIYTAPQYVIGDDMRTNAFSSMFFYFYLDAGIFGVILGCTILAVVCMNAYTKIVRRPNSNTTTYYIMIMLVLLTSNMQWAFNFTKFFLAIVMLYIFKRIDGKNKSITTNTAKSIVIKR